MTVTNIAKAENEWDIYFQEPWTPEITPPSSYCVCVCASSLFLSPSLSLSLSLSPFRRLFFVRLSLIEPLVSSRNVIPPSRQG